MTQNLRLLDVAMDIHSPSEPVAVKRQRRYEQRDEPQHDDQHSSGGERQWGFLELLPTFSYSHDPALSASQLGRLESGNRVKLPARMLWALETSTDPLFLQAQNVGAGPPFPSRSAGVEDFSVGCDVAYAPPSLLQALGIREGDAVEYTRTRLPPATRLLFQPQTDRFDRLRNPKVALEEALARWSTVEVGQLLCVREAAEFHRFLVLAVEPCSPAHLLGVRVEIDFAEPLKRVAPQVRPLQFNSPCRLLLSAAEASQLLVLRLPEGHGHTAALLLQASLLAGDADLYASQTHPEPSRQEFQWACTTIGSKTLRIDSFDSSLPIYLAVISFESSAKLDLTASLSTTTSPSPTTTSSTTSLTSTSSSASSSSSSGRLLTAIRSDVAQPGQAACQHCGVLVPERLLARHQLMCSRSFICVVCQQKMPSEQASSHTHCQHCPELLSEKHHHCPECLCMIAPEEERKHRQLIHSPLACLCGASLPLQELIQHRLTTCPYRQVECHLCQGVFFNSEVAHHLPLCQARHPNHEQDNLQNQAEQHQQQQVEIDKHEGDSPLLSSTPRPPTLPHACDLCGAALDGTADGVGEHAKTCAALIDEFAIDDNVECDSGDDDDQVARTTLTGMQRTGISRRMLGLDAGGSRRPGFPPVRDSSRRETRAEEMCPYCDRWVSDAELHLNECAEAIGLLTG